MATSSTSGVPGSKLAIWKATCTVALPSGLCDEKIVEVRTQGMSPDTCRCAAGHWHDIEWINSAAGHLEPRLLPRR